jgi:hypothetical protein
MSCISYVTWNEKFGDDYGLLVFRDMEGRLASLWRLYVNTSDKYKHFWSLRILPTIVRIKRSAKLLQLVQK